MEKQKAQVEWHNKLHSLSHTGPITIRLRGDQAAHKYWAFHSALLKRETNWQWFPLSSSSLCSLEKNLFLTGSPPLAHLSIFRTSVPQVLLCFFFFKRAHFQTGIVYTERIMYHGICWRRRVFNCTPNPTNKFWIKSNWRQHKKGIGSIKSLDKKGNKRTVSRDFFWHSFLYLKNSWFSE